MKKTAKLLLIATVPVLFLSGCCGKLQAPYTCSTPHYTAPTKTVKYIAPANTVRYVKPIQTIRYSTPVQYRTVVRTEQNRCVAYGGYDNTCVAW